MAVGLSACGSAPKAGPTTVALAPVLADSDVARYAALLAMVDADQPVSAQLVAAMAKPNAVPLRVEAVRAAGQLRARAVEPRLRALLTDRDTAVAAAAAYSLGLIADTASITALSIAVGNRTPTPVVKNDQRPRSGGAGGTVGREAAWALGEIGEPARGVISQILYSGSAPPDILYAAARLRPVPAAALTEYFWPGNSAVMRAAVYAVTRSRSPAGVRALLAAAQANDGVTRSYVARGLAHSAAGDSLGAYALRTLSALAQDSVPYVRVEAMGALRGYGPRAASAVLQAAIRDADENVRVAAAAALDSTLAGQPAESWMRAYRADSALAYRAVVVAGAFRDGIVLAPLDPANPDSWQRRADWRYRSAAAHATVGMPLDRVIALALPLTRDPDGRVRSAAYEAFADSAESPARRAYLRAGLRDADVAVRATVIDALDRAGASGGDVPAVAASYSLARSDSIVDARMAVVRYIAAAWRHDSVGFGDAGRAAVAALPAPADPVELDEARGVSVFAHWRGETPRRPPHPPEWYARIVRDIVMPGLAGHGPTASIQTDRGPIAIELYGVEAPITVDNFLSLARSGYFRDTRFHRVVPGFVAQDGDRRGDGNGGPGYDIRDELNRRRYDRGSVGMALSGPNTGGSQYFITVTPQPHLDGRYTVFGHVARGYDVVDALVQGDAITDVTAAP
jgi:cyclophilin family peptidyl-prolyl cis-trans isomerase/HEAT repeat protein